MSTLQTLNIKAIRIDGGTQSRKSISLDTVTEYREALQGGGELPPVVTHFGGTEYWLADGFHRYHAYIGEGKASIIADVREGTQREAVLFSVGANGKHGLRRTNEDKRKAVLLLVADPEWSVWSDREIARQCGVSDKTVAAYRTEHLRNSADGSVETPAATGGKVKFERGGKVHEQDTSNIGKGEKVGGSAGGAKAKAPPKVDPKAAADAAKQAEADKLAEEAHGGVDVVTKLEESYAELDRANKLLEAAQADDTKAEIIKWRKIADAAQRDQRELQTRLVEREKELQRQTGWLRRIGKAVGEDNPTKIAATVEAFVRGMRVAA